MDHSSGEIEKQALLAESVFLQFAGREVLKGATIKAETGAVTGLLGRNGCGKSALLRILFGTLKADDSFILWNSRKIKQAYTMKGLVSYLPQQSFLPGHISIGKALKDFNIPAELFGRYFPEFDIRQPVGLLSGGQKRILEVFIIIKTPTLFSLLDEPFTHIMPLHRETILVLIQEEKHRKGFIITDHLYDNLLGVSDTVYLIKTGNSMTIKAESELRFHGYLPLDDRS